MAIKTVGVLGCGLMGAGIAQVCGGRGLQDDRPRGERARCSKKGLGRIEKFLDDGVEKGKVTPESADKTLAQPDRHDEARAI